MKKMTAPAVRFKGFTAPWEQRKLGDWGYFYYGHSCPKWSVTEDSKIPCIRYGELYTKFREKITKVYSYTNAPHNMLRFSKGTEVLIPRVGEDPMDYNHCTWLSLKGVAIGEMISVFNTDQNPLFSAIMFNATLQKEFAKRVEGRSVTNLYFDKLKSIKVSYPDLMEQNKVATTFDRIDTLITLHQRKLEQQKKMRAYFLKYMFPDEGEKIPKIRFQGFTENWKQHKLRDLGKIVTGSTPSTSNPKYYSVDGIPWVTPTDIQSNLILDTERHLSEEGIKVARIVPANTILCTCIASIGKNALLPIKGSFNQQINSLTPNRDNDVYFLLAESNLWSRKMKHMAASGTMQIVNKKEFSELATMIPEYNEQKKIGLWFKKVDDLINLQQRKIDQLQTVKKFMLQNMFI